MAKPTAAEKKAAEQAAALKAKALDLTGLDEAAFDALPDGEKEEHIKAAQEELDSAAKGPKLIKMKRDKEVYPDGPHSADVHPDEVGNYELGGWTVAD